MQCLSDGWLRIKLEPSGEIISVPEHLQVELTGSADGRDFFTMLEGLHKGRRCSVKTGNLSPAAIPLRKAVRLNFDNSEQMLTHGSLKLYCQAAPSSPIPIGEHPIQLPDFPHHGGRNYMDEARCAKSWFFIGHGSAVKGMAGTDRYLHTGLFSQGCITVDPGDWNAVYELLIKCRSGDGNSVGTLVVRK